LWIGNSFSPGKTILKLTAMAGYLSMILHGFKGILHFVQDDNALKGKAEGKQRRFEWKLFSKEIFFKSPLLPSPVIHRAPVIPTWNAVERGIFITMLDHFKP
jgi:succinate dehydrogenase/fumarate reductase cytochrome b subunit